MYSCPAGSLKKQTPAKYDSVQGIIQFHKELELLVDTRDFINPPKEFYKIMQTRCFFWGGGSATETSSFMSPVCEANLNE